MPEKTATRLGAASVYLNLKKQFEDAKRQQQWKMDHEALQQRGSRETSAAQMAQKGGFSGNDLNNYVETGKFSSSMTGGERRLSPSLENAKNKRTESMLTTIEQSNAQRENLRDAVEAAKKITGGVYGRISRGFMKNLDPNNPALADWQKVKAAMTDASLINVAKTKGAISEFEQKMFNEAAANDDITSLPRIIPVLNRVLKAVNSNEQGLTKSYHKIYGEDPYSWGDISNIKEFENGFDNVMPASSQSGGKTKSGNSFRKVQ